MAYQSILNPMPVTAAALPLPAGAATSAKQPALGTAGVASTDVITVQGIASGVAQPISGTVTINAIPTGANTIGNVGLVAGAAVIGAVTQSGTWNVGSITTLPALPTGANVIGGVTQSGTWTVQPGNTANTTPWLAKIGDGTNTAAIKAASTAAAFTDPALVVDQRPGGALVTASAALADALANPTLGRQAVLPALYNGTTWDLQRGMGGNATTGDAGAKTATGNGATNTNIGNKGVQILLIMGLVTGTTPTFVLKVQGSVDGGTTFYDIPGSTTASLVASGSWGISIYPGIAVTAGTAVSGTTASANMVLPRTWRVVWTIGGTTPSFNITNIQYNYLTN